MHPGDAGHTDADSETERTSERIDGRPDVSEESESDGPKRTDGAGSTADATGSVDAARPADVTESADSTEPTDSTEPADAAEQADAAEPGDALASLPGTDVEGRDHAGLPYIFARRTVKADREALPVYVRPETETGVEELERRLCERFDGDEVMALDVREALVTTGLQHAEEVVETLEAWGYGRR